MSFLRSHPPSQSPPPTFFGKSLLPSRGLALWLDLLPSDVCDRIATYVTGGCHSCDAEQLYFYIPPNFYSNDVLNLAKSSNKQRQSVWNSIQHPFCFQLPNGIHPEDKNERASAVQLCVDLAMIFSEKETEMTIHGKPCEQEMRVLHWSNVVKMNTPLQPDIIQLIVNKPSIRILHLKVSRMNQVTTMFELIAAMNLEEIHLTGTASPFPYYTDLATKCGRIFGEKSDLRVFWAVRHSLPYLDYNINSPLFWRGFQILPASFRVGVDVEVPTVFFPLVSKFTAVDAFDLSPDLVGRLGNSVRVYKNSKPLMTIEAIDCLKSCANIEVLEIRVNVHSFTQLSRVVQHLLCLHTLVVNMNHYGPVHLEEGSVLRIVQQAPKLSDLFMSDAIVSAKEWEASFKEFGNRLEKLSVYWIHTNLFPREEEEGIERLEVFASVLRRYNRSLRELHFPGHVILQSVRKTNPEKADALEAMLRRLQFEIPELNNGRLLEQL